MSNYHKWAESAVLYTELKISEDSLENVLHVEQVYLNERQLIHWTNSDILRKKEDDQEK